jgi:FtsH-binding integral membrane protein
VWFTKPYIFLILQGDNRKIMVKMLEMLGLVLVAIMTLGFVGVFEPTIRSGTSYLFWGCAGAALMIIVYRKMKRKKEEKES